MKIFYNKILVRGKNEKTMMKIFDKIKNINCNNLFLLIIPIMVLIYSILFSHHWQYVLIDKGREFLISQEVLNGKVPYKDITLIYFPFAYYINALIFKIFGVSINSLICVLTFVCMIAMTGYYFLAKEFLKEKTALTLTMLVICSCIFAPLDLFNYIVPYSYGRLYGVFGFWGCTYSMIRFIKTNNIKFAYIAALFAGFTLCCKLEFLSIIILLIIGFSLAQKLTFKNYLKIFLTMLLFPAIVLSTLFLQGVSIKNIADSIIFGFEFARTPVMTEFLSNSGMYPLQFDQKFSEMCFGSYKLVKIIVICFIGLFLYKKYRFWPILLFTLIVINQYEYDWQLLQESWDGFSLIIAIVFLLKFKELYNNDKPALFLTLAALFLCQREFFRLSLSSYGSYSLPLILLCFFMFINKFLPKDIGGIKIYKLLQVFAVVLIIFYTRNLFGHRLECQYPIYTDKGRIYTSLRMSNLISKTRDFIIQNTDKNATILVLPEGNYLNFITGRKVDMHCFMLDRLYYDAYGDEKSRDVVADTKSDYIIIFKGLDTYLFERPFLFDDKESLLVKYIESNYEKVKRYRNRYDDSVVIYKKIKKES